MFAGHRGVTDGNELFYCPLFMVGYLMITAKGVFINQWQQCFVMCCYDTIEAKRCTLDSRVVASVASQNQQLWVRRYCVYALRTSRTGDIHG